MVILGYWYAQCRIAGLDYELGSSPQVWLMEKLQIINSIPDRFLFLYRADADGLSRLDLLVPAGHVGTSIESDLSAWPCSRNKDLYPGGSSEPNERSDPYMHVSSLPFAFSHYLCLAMHGFLVIYRPKRTASFNLHRVHAVQCGWGSCKLALFFWPYDQWRTQSRKLEELAHLHPSSFSSSPSSFLFLLLSLFFFLSLIYVLKICQGS